MKAGRNGAIINVINYTQQVNVSAMKKGLLSEILKTKIPFFLLSEAMTTSDGKLHTLLLRFLHILREFRITYFLYL